MCVSTRHRTRPSRCRATVWFWRLRFVEWEVPREAPADWPEAARKPLAEFWEARIARQTAINTTIAAKAELETLYDPPIRRSEDRPSCRAVHGREP